MICRRAFSDVSLTRSHHIPNSALKLLSGRAALSKFKIADCHGIRLRELLCAIGAPPLS